MITLNDKGLTMSKKVNRASPCHLGEHEVVVYYIAYKDVYKRILSWEASMKKQFLEFLDDIITTVIDNCEVEEVEWIGDNGKQMGDYEVTPKAGIEGKLLSVIKKHLEKVED